MSEWLEQFGSDVALRQLLGAIERILNGERTPQTIGSARRWLRRHSGHHTVEVFAELAMHALPRLLVYTATTVSYRLEHMERIRSAFPHARFLHLTRHPVGYGTSLLRLWELRRRTFRPHQLVRLVENPESIFFRLFDPLDPQPVYDPQESWYLRQSTVADFVASLEPSRCLTVRAEDLLRDTLHNLRSICQWLEVSADTDAISAMLEPSGAPSIHMPIDLQDTASYELGDPDGDAGASLEKGVPWLEDGREFCEKVKNLANRLSYY